MKILVVRVGRLGDVVMITPALVAIFEVFPNAEVTVLTGPDGVPVLRNFHPNLKQIWVHDRKKLFSFIDRHKQARNIRHEQFDRIYNFEMHPDYRRMFEKSSGQVFQLGARAPDLHYSQHCLNLVNASVETVIPQKWEYLPVTESGRNKAQTMLMEAGISSDDFVLGLHPSFSGLNKAKWRNRQDRIWRHWPPKHFGKLAALLATYAKQQNIPLKIVMSLLPHERPLGEEIQNLSGNHINIFTPPPDFDYYKAMIQRMDLLVTANTGPMHIASAINTPIIALYAGAIPEDGGPFTSPEQYTVLHAEDTEYPELGITAITPEVVLEAVIPYFKKTKK